MVSALFLSTTFILIYMSSRFEFVTGEKAYFERASRPLRNDVVTIDLSGYVLEWHTLKATCHATLYIRESATLISSHRVLGVLCPCYCEHDEHALSANDRLRLVIVGRPICLYPLQVH